MKIKTIGSHKTILSNPQSKHGYFGWPTVTILKNGKIAVGASGYRIGHVCPFGKAVLAISENEGESYTHPFPVIDTVLDDRDVGLCPFGKSGLMLTSFNNTRQMQREHCADEPDEKRNYILSYLETISDEEEKEAIGSTFRFSFDNGVTFGPIYKSPVTSPHGPIELSDGSLFWIGSVYRDDDAFSEEDVYLAAYQIDTDGRMTYLGRVDDTYENGEKLYANEPYAVELPNGDILCHFRVEQTFTVYQTVSADKGKTWSKPVRVLPDFGGAPVHLLQHSSGVLIAAYGYRQAPYEIRIMFSKDNGNTWDKDHTLYVNGISGDLGYPATVELKDGSLLTVFYAKAEENGPCVIMQQKWTLEE
ncbi:MAG: exo-alpha-sialidase [Clostridia bacterium]|nr:exo-alpha-sialidase [Clostridia bacterium]